MKLSFTKNLMISLLSLALPSPVPLTSATGLSSEPLFNNISICRGDAECFEQLAQRYWSWFLEDCPEEASFYGYGGQHGEWSDLSEDAFEQRSCSLTLFLSQLNEIDSEQLSENDRISYRILKKTLEGRLADFSFGDHYLMMDQMNGIHLEIPLIISMMPRDSVKDYEYILSRLRHIPKLLRETAALLETGVSLGITPSQAAIAPVPAQILNLIPDDPLESSFLLPFLDFPDTIEDDVQKFLLQEGLSHYERAVKPAFLKLHHYVTRHYLPYCRTTAGISNLPNGKEWYEHLVKNATTTALSPEEIHSIGLTEVRRIKDEMRETIDQTDFKGSFEEFLQFIKSDPQFFFSSKDEILSTYRSLTREIERRLPLLFSTLPALPFEVVPVPEYSEESQIAAYYYPGSPATNRPGYFFINTSFPEQRPKWEMEPLALHEAIPGHHLQISLAQELEHIPPFRKNSNFTAYVEGWGLYAERLGKELGFYRDPYSYFGRLTYEMLRAIRLVVDTGIHAKGWSPEKAFNYFRENVGMSDHEIMTEINRYMVMPGQALAYKIGELKIKELRMLATQQLGEGFDIRAFHHTWLRHGALPLDIAEEKILEWVQSIKK